jgi:hypothetical protein
MAVNLLLSYAFHEKTDLGKVRRGLVCGRLLIDSGAFTAWSKGRPIKLDAYAEFLERWRGCWDHAITLDVIGDGDATKRNTRRLHERGLPVMPVFTRGDKLADFDAMVKDAGYVAVGGTVGMGAKPQRERVAMLQRRAQDLGGGIHALGVGSITALRMARPYSGDTSMLSSAFKYGKFVYFDGRDVKVLTAADRAAVAKARNHLRAHGVDLATLANASRIIRLPMDARRQTLMQAMALAYVCADEMLKRNYHVPAPQNDRAGPHLYSSVALDKLLAHTVAGLDRKLHEGPNLYNAINNGGGPRSGEAENLAALDRKLHEDGPHLYTGMIGKNADAVETADLDRQLHQDGPHLYSALTPEFAVAPATSLDRTLHHQPAEELPSLWRVHGREHHRWCRAATREATTA